MGNSATRFQIQDVSDYVSISAKALEKGINSSLFPPDKIVGQTVSNRLEDRQTCLEEGNSLIQTTNPHVSMAG